jgi:ribonuclease VapC
MTASRLMVIDTSALIAILKVEPDATALLTGLSEPADKLISTATLLETRMVLDRQIGELGEIALNLLLTKADIRPMELDLLHVEWALKGWRRYGKGIHPAGLNFGDCFSYGLAMALSAPLLFKGDDFHATDVMSAI